MLSCLDGTVWGASVDSLLMMAILFFFLACLCDDAASIAFLRGAQPVAAPFGGGTASSAVGQSLVPADVDRRRFTLRPEDPTRHPVG